MVSVLRGLQSSWGARIITKEAVREQNNEGEIYPAINQWIFILSLANTVMSKRDLVPNMDQVVSSWNNRGETSEQIIKQFADVNYSWSVHQLFSLAGKHPTWTSPGPCPASLISVKCMLSSLFLKQPVFILQILISLSLKMIFLANQG